MIHKVHCVKMKKELEGLDHQPYPGELGKRIYHHISKQAWQEWLGHQTMLINEYRLNMMEGEDRDFLVKEMEKFLFGTGSTKPEDYVAPEAKPEQQKDK